MPAPAETGTVVEILAPSATVTAQQRERDQRYQELLRSSPPPAPVAPQPPAEKPSLLQRMASAIGLGEKKPATAPAPRPPAQSNPNPNPNPASHRSQPSTNVADDTKKTSQPAEESDLESDRNPPQLVGLEFMPPQVQDGETLTLAVTAQDDLSGIRTISGVIANPAGATVSGFAAQREGETNRYLAKIVIPKDAAEGTWHIKYLSMADNAANAVNLAYGQGLYPALASFRVVSSRSDANGPELKDVWLDKRAISAGDKTTIFVRAEDDKAGVQLVSGVFISPSKQARLGFGCRFGASGAWECTLTVPECVDCGLWQLEQIQMQDKANNTTTARADNQLVSRIQVDISGDRCDGQAPVLTGLSLAPNVVSNSEASVITVSATIQDDNCGGATLSGLATGPNGQRLNILFEPSQDGQNFQGRINIAKSQAAGTYNVTWIQALDKGQNLKAYSQSEPIVGRVSFRVE